MRRRDFLRAGTGFGAVSLGSIRLPAASPKSRFDDEAISKIEKLLPRLLREGGVPGVAIAVVSEGRLRWQRAFGVKDVTTREPIDEQTIFEAASVSKTVFAYVALKLCERGTLDLDTPLTKYSKVRFVNGDARIDRVTARHALSHTTGFPDWRSTPSLEFAGDPGQQFRYSGEGYYYLQSILTQLAGRTLPTPCGRYEADFEVCATDFDAFMRRSLLDPFGMTSSGYEWREQFERTAARPHDVKGQPLTLKKPNAADIARYGAVGELRTTVSDYSKFLLAVLNQPTGPAFLRAAMRDEMIRPHVKLDPAQKIDGADSWALGWAIQERPSGNVVLHSGGQAGFRSLTMASVGRKSGFVIFTNGDRGGFICYDHALGNLLNPLLVS